MTTINFIHQTEPVTRKLRIARQKQQRLRARYERDILNNYGGMFAEERREYFRVLAARWVAPLPQQTEIAAEFDEARELEEADYSDMIMSYGREGY